MLALLLAGAAAGPAVVWSSAAAVADGAIRLIDWGVAHWGCPQPVDYGSVALCTASWLEAPRRAGGPRVRRRPRPHPV